MVKKKEEPVLGRPAESPEARENQLIALAVNLAEKQLRDGSASPSVINHYLKMASTREKIERQMLEKQAALLDAKAQNIADSKDNEQIAKAALEALKSYNSGSR